MSLRGAGFDPLSKHVLPQINLRYYVSDNSAVPLYPPGERQQKRLSTGRRHGRKPPKPSIPPFEPIPSGETNMRRVLAVVIAVGLTASCTDSPTSPASTAPGGPDLDASPSGCVSDGICTLEPIIVIGDPRGGGGSGGGGAGGGGDGGGGLPTCESMESWGDATVQSCPGGGGGGEPYDPPDDQNDDGVCTADEYGTVCEGVDRPECERKPDAPSECVTRFPNTTEWAALGQIIDRMTENTDYCRGAKALAQGMYAAGREGGRLVLWDGRNYTPGTNQQEMVWGRNNSDYRGRIIQLDSYLAFQVRWLLAHEALHAYLNSINWPGTPKEQDAWIGARQSECAG